MSDQEALRDEIAQAIHRQRCCDREDNGWQFYRDHADAVLPVLQRRETALRADAWQEGFDAGENMAHLYGHVDYWEVYPVNPYRSILPTQGDTE
jgi:uncharacterized protein (DUF952 family)